MNENDLRTARDAHRAALACFLASASAIDESRWATPRREGKWSPGQIAEHLTAAYDVLIDEMNGGTGMRVRTSWWQRVLLRFWLVPKLLRTGTFPEGARAPREVRPPEVPAPKNAALSRLRERADEFDRRIGEFAKSPAARLTHAYFGKVRSAETVRFCEIHLLHHEKQLG